MATKSSYNKVNKLAGAPKKASRIIKLMSHKATHDVIVSGYIGHSKRTFRFKAISEKQQMKQRNSAYQFFSID